MFSVFLLEFVIALGHFAFSRHFYFPYTERTCSFCSKHQNFHLFFLILSKFEVSDEAQVNPMMPDNFNCCSLLPKLLVWLHTNCSSKTKTRSRKFSFVQPSIFRFGSRIAVL